MTIPRADLDALSSLTFNADAELQFDLLKYCLLWSDERPAVKLSSAGAELLTDLWIVRGFLHRGLPEKQWGLDPKYFQEVWQFATAEIPQWPGFKRLKLPASERAYLTACLASPLPTL